MNKELQTRIARTLVRAGFTNQEVQAATGLKKMQVAGFAAAAARR